MERNKRDCQHGSLARVCNECELENRCRALESIILDIHWMARRYADTRRSYATGLFNRAMDEALDLGLPLKDDPDFNATYYADDAVLGKWHNGTFVREANRNLLNDVG